MSYKTRYIPVPYARIAHQLYHEHTHGEVSLVYEAQRRGDYAARVLDAFGMEIRACKHLETDGPHAGRWHSAVLTPILQRQIYGIPDTVASWAHEGIKYALRDPPADKNDGNGGHNDDDDDDDNRNLTIYDVTKFYPSGDPLNPQTIPIFRRNLLLIREARWHLAVLSGVADQNDTAYFTLTVEDQDTLLQVQEGEEPAVPDSNATGIPGFGPLERGIIRRENLVSFFEGDDNVVSILLSLFDTR